MNRMGRIFISLTTAFAFAALPVYAAASCEGSLSGNTSICPHENISGSESSLPPCHREMKIAMKKAGHGINSHHQCNCGHLQKTNADKQNTSNAKNLTDAQRQAVQVPVIKYTVFNRIYELNLIHQTERYRLLSVFLI